MIRIENGDDVFLVATESVVIAIWNVLEPRQQQQVADGLAGERVLSDPGQMILTLDGVLMEICRSLPQDRKEKVVGALLAMKERQPVATLSVRRVVSPKPSGGGYRMNAGGA